MFIQTEDTPNPATLKFLPGCDVLGAKGGIRNITKPEEAAESPLATALFALRGVSGVMLGADFISVTKAEDVSWGALRAPLLAAIMDFFVAGKPVVLNEQQAEDTSSDDPIVQQIKELLETRVRPVVTRDGGDIVFHGYENGIVYLQMRGACAGCPGATATLKRGVEGLLKQAIPEVQEVRRI